MATSPKLGLPFVAQQQQQPEVTHNEAIILLQSLIAGALTIGSNTAPGSPVEGATYVVGAAPTGAWAGWANHVAVYYGGWRFVPGRDSAGVIIPMDAVQEGLRVYVQADDTTYLWDGAAWVNDGAGFQPFIAFAANQFGARASTGAYEAKPISDAGLTLLAQATQALIRTAGMGLTTVGNNMSQVATPGAVSFYQINTDGTVTVNAAAAQRTALGLGTAALADTGASGHTLPYLDAINTFSTDQNFLGTVRIGTTSTPSGLSGSLLIAGSWTAYSEAASLNNDAVTYSSGSGAHCAAVRMRRARNTAASPAVVVVNDDLGQLIAQGHDGTSFVSAARILAEAEGTIGTGIVPGRISVATANAAGALTEALRVNSLQNLQVLNGVYLGSLTTAPTARLHLAAGSATAGTAPTKKTAGALNAVAEAGAAEYNGNHYSTPAGLQRFAFGGTVAVFTTDSGNTTTAETTLRTVSLAPGALQVTGDGVEQWGHLSVANTIATKTQKVKFGPAGSETTIFDSGAMAGATASEMILQIKIARISSSAVRCSVAPTLLTALSPQYTEITGLTLSNAMSLIITSQSGASGATNDTIARVGRAEFKPGI